MLDLMKAIGEQMRARSKQEQMEKAKNYQILNEHVKKGQILFTGSSLMEQFPIAEIARNHGVEKMIYNRGIGGYTTDDFLTNIDTVLFDLEPSKIFINRDERHEHPRGWRRLERPSAHELRDHFKTNQRAPAGNRSLHDGLLPCKPGCGKR